MDEEERPPVGLRPRDIWRRTVSKERGQEVLEAIMRYARAGKPIPPEWLEEVIERWEESCQ